jgi:glycerate 2-kinase
VKHVAERLFREILAAIDIPATLARKLRRHASRMHAAGAEFDLRDYREIAALAFGKASFALVQGLNDVLAPDYLPRGILVAPLAAPRHFPGWRALVGGHPIPNSASFVAGREILEFLSRSDDRSLVFFLISGGGSAMVEHPLDPAVTLEDFQALNRALVTCGAPIEEINVIRKHLSATKGGRLAAAAPQATKITLGVSDVPIGHESALASGPTLPDPTTIADAQRIVDKHALLAKFPPSIRRIFESGQLRETPKENDAAFARAHFELLLGEHELFHAAHHACEAAGFICLCDETVDDWPIDQAADHLLSLLADLKAENPAHHVAVIADGEVRSPVTGDGVGGRNSAFALACVPRIAGTKMAVLSAGTDGIDGNSPAAGALADGDSLARAQAAGLDPADYFRSSDSYTFFARLGDAILTGPTGNNLRDLRILLAP